VLDRLNPLLEPGGVLLVNECGQVDGSPRVVTPHPDFRLFLVVDPASGEVSRAMRTCRSCAFFLALLLGYRAPLCMHR
jgi:midasin